MDVLAYNSVVLLVEGVFVMVALIPANSLGDLVATSSGQTVGKDGATHGGSKSTLPLERTNHVAVPKSE
eukprot:5062377-Ditylum_brightwellii.AAC.1